MKKINVSYVFVLMTIFLISCESSDDAITPLPTTGGGTEEPNDPITDDLLLIGATNLGAVYEIGNNVGGIQNAGQILKENESSILPIGTLMSTNDNIYAVEYVYNPSPTNNLLIYEISTNSTQIVPLTLPATIMGSERGFVALTVNDANSLVGILSENVLVNGATKHLVTINLQDNSVSELGITFTEDTITSMEKVGTHVYVSTWSQGFLDIDTATNSVTNLNGINGSRLAQINTSELALMQASTTSVNGAIPATVNLSNQTITPNDEADSYGLVSVFGSTVFENQTYMNLVATNTVYLGILKTNFTTGESILTPVNSTNVDRNMVIVATRPTN